MLLAPSGVSDFAVVVSGKTFDRLRHPDNAGVLELLAGGFLEPRERDAQRAD